LDSGSTSPEDRKYSNRLLSRSLDRGVTRQGRPFKPLKNTPCLSVHPVLFPSAPLSSQKPRARQDQRLLLHLHNRFFANRDLHPLKRSLLAQRPFLKAEAHTTIPRVDGCLVSHPVQRRRGRRGSCQCTSSWQRMLC
jgi:hypothetical protein